MYHINVISLEYQRMSQIMARTNRVTGNESSREQMFLGANTLKCESSTGPFRSREREGQGAKGPRSESSRERIGQGTIGRFARIGPGVKRL